jgi:peptidoglycan/xylan/chitin deacetylase (PgdA/CDA1 family)
VPSFRELRDTERRWRRFPAAERLAGDGGARFALTFDDGPDQTPRRRCSTLESAAGVRAALFRPPYGRFSAGSYGACRAAGLTPVYWSGWGCDWEPIPAARIADLVARGLDPGTIVLLHDSARYAYRDSAQATAAAVGLVLAAAGERGLEPRTLEPRALFSRPARVAPR